ncbi:MAG: 2-iminoacetate synthase ThiH [Verrucomicrobiales bacterium]
MSFVDTFDRLPQTNSASLQRFRCLLQPMDRNELEGMASQSSVITRQHFGRAIRLFAPLYLSNECINNCSYCGFSRDNPILRVTLNVDQVVAEAKHLASLGFRSILLVAGEHPRFVSEGYLQECITAIRDFIPSVALEVGPMETPDYSRMVETGCEGLVVYQESYDRAAYAQLHTAGPKKNFNWRLECPERAYAAGFRRLGIGALFGLADWRSEAESLAAHLAYLQQNCWKASYTVSFPRIRPAAGDFQPLSNFTDRNFLQLVCAFRLSFPEVGIVLSTRESAVFRDGIAPLGVTSMSAGSHTEPGGYTGKGNDSLHLTINGKRVELKDSMQSCSNNTGATEQFGIADHRSPAEVASSLTGIGLDPVWKDWEGAILRQCPQEATSLT